MNYSNCNERTSSNSDYAVVFFMSFLLLLTLAFNLFLIVVIKTTKVLHTCTNAFVLSIAVGDIIRGCFKMPVVILSKLNDKWEPTLPTCHVTAFFFAIGQNLATFSLMTLSIDRCIAIYKPVKYAFIITSSSTKVFVMCIWICSIAIAAIPFIGKTSYFYDPRESVCLFSSSSATYHVILVVILSTIIPAFVIIVSIVIIIREARARHRVFALAHVPIVLAGIQPKKPMNTLRAMKSLFLIVFWHLIFCVVEYLLVLIKAYQSNCLPKLFIDVKIVWTSLCCVVTPAIITCCNKNYYKRLKKLLCKCCLLTKTKKCPDFSVSTGLHSILEASYTISHFRPIPSNIILLANESSRVHLRNSVHANPSAQSRILFEKPMLRKTLSSPDC